jgi:hypothetical protein
MDRTMWIEQHHQSLQLDPREMGPAVRRHQSTLEVSDKLHSRITANNFLHAMIL